MWRTRERKPPASSVSLLSRLVGIETEYGLYRGNSTNSSTSLSSFSAFDIFDQLVPWLKKRLPTAPSSRHMYRVFLANGACIGVETNGTHHNGGGLIEVATPECRSPLELIGYQTVLDRWMVESLSELQPQTDARWLKNSSDGGGVTYGQHENYEVRIAQGWRLAMWRMGLLLILPMLVLYRMFAVAWTGLLAGWSRMIRPLQPQADIGFNGSQINTKAIATAATPYTKAEPWMLTLAAGLRWCHWPIAMCLHCLIWMFILVPHRRWLGAFFASRAAVEGSGHVDRHGRFWLSARASKINSMIGFGSYWNEAPIFVTGHWLTALLADRTLSFQAWRNMFQATQRIQIALGDSTPNERSQYIRIATTTLVLDLVESGRLKGLPCLKNPLRSLRAFATDSSLMRTVADKRGLVWTAIDLQRQYAGAVRMMISHLQPSTASSKTEEARSVLSAWQETLDHLQESESDEQSQKWLLGRVDWFSKRWLMDRSAPKSSWAALKKIDLKFHELDNRGYFRQLVRALDIPQMVSPASLDRACRMPPANSPAIKRSYLIREFADHYPDFAVDWNEVVWTDEQETLVRVVCS